MCHRPPQLTSRNPMKRRPTLFGTPAATPPPMNIFHVLTVFSVASVLLLLPAYPVAAGVAGVGALTFVLFAVFVKQEGES